MERPIQLNYQSYVTTPQHFGAGGGPLWELPFPFASIPSQNSSSAGCMIFSLSSCRVGAMVSRRGSIMVNLSQTPDFNRSRTTSARLGHGAQSLGPGSQLAVSQNEGAGLGPLGSGTALVS